MYKDLISLKSILLASVIQKYIVCYFGAAIF